MKKYIVAAGLFLLMNSCLNNDFMEVYPKDQQTEANGRIKKLRYLHPLIHGIMNTSAG